MGTWAVITYPETELFLANWHWVEKALAYVKTDEGAPQKKAVKKIKTKP
jgi:hypothetical protein